MKLFLIEQNSRIDYDTYDSAVVVAKNEENAKFMHPRDGTNITAVSSYDNSWVRDPRDVTVTFLGNTAIREAKVICASFNAG